MTVPTYDQFIEPILRFLAKYPEGAPAKSAHDAAAASLGLADEDRLQMLSSGTQLVYKNRAGWAHDRLKRAGLSSSPKRGVWRLTPEGSAFVKAHPSPLPAEVTQKLAMDFIGVKLKVPGAPGEPLVPSAAPPAVPSVASPDDQLELAVIELR